MNGRIVRLLIKKFFPSSIMKIYGPNIAIVVYNRIIILPIEFLPYFFLKYKYVLTHNRILAKNNKILYKVTNDI